MSAFDPKRTWAPRGVTQGTVYSRLSDILLAAGVALMAVSNLVGGLVRGAAPPNANVCDYESKVKLGRRLADAFPLRFRDERLSFGREH
jgi:hypothetical protein